MKIFKLNIFVSLTIRKDTSKNQTQLKNVIAAVYTVITESVKSKQDSNSLR